jgi:hypothetical protein
MGNNNHVVVSHRLVFRDMWAGVLSWWRRHLWLRQSSRLFLCTFSLKGLKRHSKSQELTIVLGRTNSWYNRPFAVWLWHLLPLPWRWSMPAGAWVGHLPSPVSSRCCRSGVHSCDQLASLHRFFVVESRVRYGSHSESIWAPVDCAIHKLWERGKSAGWWKGRLEFRLPGR